MTSAMPSTEQLLARLVELLAPLERRLGWEQRRPSPAIVLDDPGPPLQVAPAPVNVAQPKTQSRRHPTALTGEASTENASSAREFANFPDSKALPRVAEIGAAPPVMRQSGPAVGQRSSAAPRSAPPTETTGEVRAKAARDSAKVVTDLEPTPALRTVYRLPRLRSASAEPLLRTHKGADRTDRASPSEVPHHAERALAAVTSTAVASATVASIAASRLEDSPYPAVVARHRTSNRELAWTDEPGAGAPQLSLVTTSAQTKRMATAPAVEDADTEILEERLADLLERCLLESGIDLA